MSESKYVRRKLQFSPSIILTTKGGPYVEFSRRFALYQWFCLQLKQYKKRDTPWEWLNGTSSINNNEPYAIFDFDEPFRRLSMLLTWLGTNSDRGKFLRYCKIRKWSDLEKSFTVPVAHSDDFPHSSWFELRGRHFKVSPNKSHPKATWVMSGSVQLNYLAKLWCVRIEYGYIHDSSHWFHNICQNPGERLNVFTKRANAEINDLMVPESHGFLTGSHRLARERDWAKTHNALKAIFYDSQLRMCGWEDKLSDLLQEVSGTSLTASRITLTAARLKTLTRWVTQTKKEAKARAAKEKREQEKRQQRRGY